MQNKKLKGMGLAITAICFSFIMPIVTYICGGIGLSKANRQIKEEPDTPTKVKTMCISSMIITTVLLIIAVIRQNI